MKLHLRSYWRAGAPYRVRIGLNLKGLAYTYLPIDLLAGEQSAEDYTAVNPQGLVPALETEQGVLTQSLAILEWLDETHPEPPLLPRDPFERATVRAMALAVACDIHPLNNVRVQKALAAAGVDEASRGAWSRRWIEDGFRALETLVARHGQGWCYGESPTLADCCLVPQLYGAGRFSVDMTPYPALAAVGARAAEHPAFLAAHPDRQPDARPG
jgi:maleylacetoacetate isomerase